MFSLYPLHLNYPLFSFAELFWARVTVAPHPVNMAEAKLQVQTFVLKYAKQGTGGDIMLSRVIENGNIWGLELTQ